MAMTLYPLPGEDNPPSTSTISPLSSNSSTLPLRTANMSSSSGTASSGINWDTTSNMNITPGADTMEESDLVDSGVYNNERDADIVIKFGEHQIFAHRVVLRMWSPFFQRSLSSGFSVATNKIFYLDDQDEPEAVHAMLRHMYGQPYWKHPDNTISSWDDFECLSHHMDVYMIADKYDCPSIRKVAVEKIIAAFETLFWKKELAEMIPVIADICGPKAPEFADRALRVAVVEWLSKHFACCLHVHQFKDALKDGSLLDNYCASQVLLKFSDRVNQYAEGNPQSSLACDAAYPWSGTCPYHYPRQGGDGWGELNWD